MALTDYTPGRLRRTLAPITADQLKFYMYSEPTGGIYEDEIESVSIFRGTDGRATGSNPSVMELTLTGQRLAKVSGHNIRFGLRESPASLLATHLGGSATGADIETRYTGRVGTTAINDRGTRSSTTYSAASWIAQMNYSPVHYTPTAGQYLHTVIQGLAHADEPLRGITLTSHGNLPNIATTDSPQLFKDGIGKYAADLGVLMRETRDGRTQVMGHEYRYTMAMNRLSSAIPLIRSEAISPADYEQPNERPGAIVQFKVTNENNLVSTRTAETTNPNGELRETVERDWSYIKVTNTDNQPYREAYAQVYESNNREFRIPKIKIDLLYLIGSNSDYHKQQAAQLLALEAGDPIFLSGDWATALGGIHFAEGIRENITPDEWSLELSLVPIAQAIGYTGTSVPAKAWDSAVHPWDSETREWNQA
ncbi:hypothetical protein ACIOTN_17320 [Glutamicibacter sp. NPDC087661]|uniref:hypothetical protein n=1 Tax=Glutamicibacter sp. NPDC087661 TaxID=3363996 RepID=UPI00380C4699